MKHNTQTRLELVNAIRSSQQFNSQLLTERQKMISPYHEINDINKDPAHPAISHGKYRSFRIRFFLSMTLFIGFIIYQKCYGDQSVISCVQVQESIQHNLSLDELIRYGRNTLEYAKAGIKQQDFNAG